MITDGELCKKRERKALKRMLHRFTTRGCQEHRGYDVRQVTLGDGIRVELPRQEVELADHMARPGLLRRAWRGFKGLIRRRP